MQSMRTTPRATQTHVPHMFLQKLKLERTPKKRQTTHLHRNPRRPKTIPTLDPIRSRHSETRRRRPTARNNKKRSPRQTQSRHDPSHWLRKRTTNRRMAPMAKTPLQTSIIFLTNCYKASLVAVLHFVSSRLNHHSLSDHCCRLHSQKLKLLLEQKLHSTICFATSTF